MTFMFYRSWIAVIARGDKGEDDLGNGECTFVDKVKNAMNANFSAAIIYNQDSDKVILMDGLKIIPEAPPDMACPLSQFYSFIFLVVFLVGSVKSVSNGLFISFVVILFFTFCR